MSLVGHADTITGLALAPMTKSSILSNSMDGTVMMWDVKPYCENESRLMRVFMGATHNFEKNLLRCAWSPDEQLITAGSADRTVNIWNVETGELRHRLGGHQGSVNETSLHSGLIASGSSDKTVVLGKLDE